VPADPTTLPKLGIIAGGGDLPARLIEACEESGRPFFVIALKEQADHPAIETAPHTWLRLGKAAGGEILLRDAGVEEVVFAGSVQRPSIKDLVPDFRTAKLLMKATVRGLGDDGLLGLVVREFESSGFTIVGAHTILPDLLAPEGPLGRHEPDKRASADILRGVAVVRGLGELDIGQACIVQQGIVLGVEAIEGTDALIRRTAELRRKGQGGVLVKLKKPNQDERVDLPTIGDRTVDEAHRAGLRGIAVEADSTLILDRSAVAAAADKAGLFVVGLSSAP
jgi:DUF1009 family protein